jgi:hypothetical protein
MHVALRYSDCCDARLQLRNGDVGYKWTKRERGDQVGEHSVLRIGKLKPECEIGVERVRRALKKFVLRAAREENWMRMTAEKVGRSWSGTL